MSSFIRPKRIGYLILSFNYFSVIYGDLTSTVNVMDALNELAMEQKLALTNRTAFSKTASKVPGDLRTTYI